MIWVLAILLVSVPAGGWPAPPAPPVWIEAQAYTNGPFGDSWTVRIGVGGAGTARIYYRTGEKAEKKVALTAAQVTSVRRAIDRARFAELPPNLAAKTVFIDGPEHRLYVLSAGKVHRVSLLDPGHASGAEVERFKDVWRALAACLPIPPPAE